jgi:hypothetical protein
MTARGGHVERDAHATAAHSAHDRACNNLRRLAIHLRTVGLLQEAAVCHDVLKKIEPLGEALTPLLVERDDRRSAKRRHYR